MYKIIAYSAWQYPQEFFANSKEEMEQIKEDLKNQQFAVEVEFLGEEE